MKKKRIKKIVIAVTIVSTILTYSAFPIYASSTTHRVVSGDTLWKIAQQHKVSLDQIYTLNPRYINNPTIMIGDIIQIKAEQNNTTYTVKSGDTPWTISNQFGVTLNAFLNANNIQAGEHIYPGQQVLIPNISSNPSTGNQDTNTYIVQNGDTPWNISNKFKVTLDSFLKENNIQSGQHIYPGQIVIIPSNSSHTPNPSNPPNPGDTNQELPSKHYIYHVVKSGDNLWQISIQYGIPFQEVLTLNGFSQNHIIQIGDIIKIPVYHIPIKPTPGPQYGELLDWWTEAQYVVPIGKIFTVMDFETGSKWTMKRTLGANHADCEPLTSSDAQIMQEVWGGGYSWVTRAVIIEVDGRRIAASASSMPHDVQHITDNHFDGHADIHFFNSTRHKDGKQDPRHQEKVLIAAGQK